MHRGVRKITWTDVQTVRVLASLIVRKRGLPPTRRELAREIGCVTRAVHDRLKRLRAHHAIDGYEPRATRALSLRWLPCLRISDHVHGLIVPIDHAAVRFPTFKKRRSA
jgi:hypothetical protein